MKEKRAVLDGVAAELRRIIGEPTALTHAELSICQVAYPTGIR